MLCNVTTIIARAYRLTVAMMYMRKHLYMNDSERLTILKPKYIVSNKQQC